MKTQLAIPVILFLLCFVLPARVLPRTWYVNTQGTGDAPTIQAAVDSAGAGDVILVAPGTYRWTDQNPDPAQTEYAMILYSRDVTGFELRSEAGPEETILDAEGMGRVFYIMAYNDIVIYGFTVRGGVAPHSYDSGGGLIGHLSTPVIRNCIFTGNRAQYGGGFWYGGVSEPRVENCVFIDNTADVGGGICLVNSSTRGTFYQCLVRNNTAALRGGGVYVYNYNASFEYCTITGNTALESGGGLGCRETEQTVVTNCTISENSAPLGGGIYLHAGPNVTVERSIISYSHEGAAFSMSLPCTLQVECCDLYGNAGGDTIPAGAIDVGHNIYLDPQFCGKTGSFNYYLQSDSPCLPLNNPFGILCQQVGAFPCACGTVSARSGTWGNIKKLFGE